jgi:hypothetical protein
MKLVLGRDELSRKVSFGELVAQSCETLGVPPTRLCG